MISLGPISHCKMKKKKKSLVFVYVFSFYVRLSLAIDQVLLLAQVSAGIDVLLCYGLQNPGKRRDWMAGKAGKCATCDPAVTMELSWCDKGNVSDKTVH